MGNYKEQFETIVRRFIKRDGVENLLIALAKSDFYTAPASTRYHDSEESGLVKHSIKVFSTLESDLDNNLEGITTESIAIAGLFHDLCKVGFYKVSSRNVKDEKGKWIQVPYYEVDDKLPLGHGEKSVMMILQYMKLTTEEMMAIRWHMSGFEPKENYPALSSAYSEYPLAVYLHIADLKATYIK